MIQTKIKSIEITEVRDLDPAKYVPEDPEDFRCTCGLTIGPANSEGGEQFYLTVCSPKALAKAAEKDGFVWGRHYFIVPEYNLKTITGIITKFVSRCSGGTWKDVAGKLSRFVAWEFEDYQKP
jgi:hypothetical protein